MFELKIFLELVKIRNSLSLDSCELKKIQEDKIRSLLNLAYGHTKYYHDSFKKKGVTPSDFKRLSDITKFPFVTKQHIQESYEDFLTQAHEPVFIHSTSGSTGLPLRVSFDEQGEVLDIANAYRALLKNGFSLFDKVVEVCSPVHIRSYNPWYTSFGLFRKKRLSVFDSSEKNLRIIMNFRPHVIQSYASSIFIIAEEILSKDISLGFVPKLIFTSSEILTKSMRNTIEKAFGCKVIDLYGSVEFRRLAFECNKRHGYHLCSDQYLLEVLDQNDRPVSEGSGRLVVTSLINTFMLFIRYELGDQVTITKRKCTCGLNTPLLTSINGKQDDFIVMPSGSKVSPIAVNFIEDIPGFSRLKVIQRKKDLIELQLIKDSRFSDSTVKEINKVFHKVFNGEKVRLDIKFVKSIEQEKTGKIRTVISMVK